ncbi:alpha/beta hydrolase [Aestuariivita sp.]|uniref:alpha/beta hydrolase n=1 Tax=Aestuariivita sp. TaxID=1872407 RepID=UPI003419B559
MSDRGSGRPRPLNYDSYLDEEVRAFIARTDALSPPDAVNLSISDQRRVYDDLCRAFDTGYPDGVATRDLDAGGVPVRLYEAGAPSVSVIYLHGGGFVVGGLESHDSICAEICSGTGHRVISVDYRLAPEHPHPASFDDAVTATAWVLERFPGPVVLVGDSAGGTLAAAVTHAMRGRTDRITGQLLIYPGLGGDMTRGSYVTHANAPGLTTADIGFYQSVRTGGAIPEGDPSYAPLQDSDFTGLPHTIIVTAQCDPLADDGAAYRDAIRAAGGKVHWISEAGLIHGYLRARTLSTRARDSFATIVADLQCLGQGVWPYD